MGRLVGTVSTVLTTGRFWAENRVPAETLGAQCFTGDLLVGAVGIENNTAWNFKDLEEMARSAKALKKNNRESSGILIGPSMAPRFFSRH